MKSQKIYQQKTIGKIGNFYLNAMVCINDDGEHLKQTIEEMKKKYNNLELT